MVACRTGCSLYNHIIHSVRFRRMINWTWKENTYLLCVSNVSTIEMMIAVVLPSPEPSPDPLPYSSSSFSSRKLPEPSSSWRAMSPCTSEWEMTGKYCESCNWKSHRKLVEMFMALHRFVVVVVIELTAFAMVCRNLISLSTNSDDLVDREYALASFDGTSGLYRCASTPVDMTFCVYSPIFSPVQQCRSSLLYSGPAQAL